MKKYSEEKIISDLKFIYEKYGELSSYSIKDSYTKNHTISISVCDRIGTRDKLYELIGIKMETKSFYYWCLENNHMEFINTWSYNDNIISPKNIPFSSHSEYVFVCDKCGTKRKYKINSITNMNVKLKCPYCNSFEKWCIDNNPSILERFDYIKNKFKPSDISYGSKKIVYLKCENNKHASSKYIIKTITNGSTNCRCAKCGSIAQWGIDTFGENFLDIYWDYDKNDINPFDVAMHNQTKSIWIKCKDIDCHGSYETKAVDLTRTKDKITCPYCYNTRVHKFDSLGYLYPDILPLWSDKNIKSPYEYKPKSAQRVWFKCNCGKHSDTLRTISNAYYNNFECPDCIKERTESKLEGKVRKYITESLKYNSLHEHKCTIIPINPKTNRQLPFDNEIVDLKLIIEVNGIQHYEITNFAIMSAKKFGTSPEFEIEYQKWKDNYKKEYALNHGYEYLIIPYWSEKDDIYKNLIDNKIKEILKEAV